MCRKVTCHQCGKPTWAGCGAHADQVLDGIPDDERCPRDHTGPAGGALRRVFGR